MRYLPHEGKYVVQLGRYRGEIEVEEAAFFVRAVDLDAGTIALSDRTTEPLDPDSLEGTPDGALVCRVKRALAPPHGLPARFTHAAQAELLLGVEAGREGPALRLAGTLRPLHGL